MFCILPRNRAIPELSAFQITLIDARIVKDKTAACVMGLQAVTAQLILTGDRPLSYIFVYAGQMSSF